LCRGEFVGQAARVRWQALFDDLDAQLAAEEAAELRAEVADRTRRELALVRIRDRLEPSFGAAVAVAVHGGGTVHGRLLDAGGDWLLLEEAGARELLVPLAAVLTVAGLSARSGPPGAEGEVGKRLDLRWALRGLARSRSAVRIGLRDGSTISGTVDRVGADHLDLAEHAPGEARRPGAVRQVRMVPLAALASVASG
jgi:hypothetical protein